MEKINNLAFYLYFLLLASFPLGVVVRFTPFTNVNIYPQDLLIIFVFLITVVAFIKDGSLYRKIFKSILLFNLVAFTSLVLNSSWLSGGEFLISLSYLVRLNMYVSLLFLGLFNFNKFRRAVLKRTFLIVSLVMVLFGIVQYFLYNNLRNLYYLGWDEHLYRLFSTFLDPNFAGLFFALFTVFLFGRILNSKKNEYYLYSILFLTLLTLVLTYSRTAIIALIAGVIYLMISLRKIKLLVVSLVVLSVGVLIVSDFSIEGMNPLRIASSEARVISMHTAISIFSDSPLYGVGFNAYRYAQIDKGFRDKELSAISNADAGTDNSFLFVLATTGIIGFGAYLYLWTQLLSATKKIVAVSLVVTLFTGSLFVNALFYIPIMLWVFIYFGLFVLGKNSNSRT